MSFWIESIHFQWGRIGDKFRVATLNPLYFYALASWNERAEEDIPREYVHAREKLWAALKRVYLLGWLFMRQPTRTTLPIVTCPLTQVITTQLLWPYIIRTLACVFEIVERRGRAGASGVSIMYVPGTLAGYCVRHSRGGQPRRWEEKEYVV